MPTSRILPVRRSSSVLTARSPSRRSIRNFSALAGAGDCIPQPSPSTASTRLDALSDRLLHRLQYRNFGSNESLVANHTVDVGGNHAGVRYYQLKRNLPGGVVRRQRTGQLRAGRESSLDGQRRHGSLRQPRRRLQRFQHEHIPVHSLCGTAGDGSVRNGLFQGEATLQAGGGSQTDPSSRWGDYSMLAVDPSDDCTFWYTTQYYSDSSPQDWQTSIGAFKFAVCSPAPKGTLQGTVTDATTSLPITNAIVRTADGFLRTTSNSGTYSMTLPPGTYNATASALNHGSQAASGLVVTNNGTVTQNFSLPQVPVMTLISSAFSDAAGNNNGAIDLNECISLSVILQNTGLITASNIVATLSTSTAGVTISQGTSAYANASAGVTRTNLTPFQISTTLVTALRRADQSDAHRHAQWRHQRDSPSIQHRFEPAPPLDLMPTDTPVPIDPFFGGSSALTVSGITSSIAKVTVSLYLTSDENSELDIYLIGPDGTTVALATSTGGAFGSDYGTACARRMPVGTTFDDAASTLIYDGSPPFTGDLSAGRNAVGLQWQIGLDGQWRLDVGRGQFPRDRANRMLVAQHFPTDVCQRRRRVQCGQRRRWHSGFVATAIFRQRHNDQCQFLRCVRPRRRRHDQPEGVSGRHRSDE